MCEKHDYVRVCKHAREKKCVLYCMSDCTFSVCLCGCVCAHACMMEGVDELGLSILDQHHSDWEDPVLLSWPHMYTRLTEK